MDVKNNLTNCFIDSLPSRHFNLPWCHSKSHSSRKRIKLERLEDEWPLLDDVFEFRLDSPLPNVDALLWKTVDPVFLYIFELPSPVEASNVCILIMNGDGRTQTLLLKGEDLEGASGNCDTFYFKQSDTILFIKP